MTAAYSSQALADHDRCALNSSNERIDNHFRQAVSQDVKRSYAACYVLIDQASARLAGFYTLSSHSVALTELTADVARKLPRYPSVPAVLMGGLGQDLSLRGQHVGAMLLADAITRLAAAPIGIHAICADAVDNAASTFYREHQFVLFASRPNSLYPADEDGSGAGDDEGRRYATAPLVLVAQQETRADGKRQA